LIGNTGEKTRLKIESATIPDDGLELTRDARRFSVKAVQIRNACGTQLTAGVLFLTFIKQSTMDKKRTNVKIVMLKFLNWSFLIVFILVGSFAIFYGISMHDLLIAKRKLELTYNQALAVDVRDNEAEAQRLP